jgi:putative IMPACT (imprinted ancient) family translation regulator
VLVIVVRYFGGTKLGAGGLVRAYGDAAKAVLDRSTVDVRTRTEQIQVTFDYGDTASARQCIEAYDVAVVGSTYTDRTTLILAIAASKRSDFEAAFREALAGRCEISIPSSTTAR